MYFPYFLHGVGDRISIDLHEVSIQQAFRQEKLLSILLSCESSLPVCQAIDGSSSSGYLNRVFTVCDERQTRIHWLMALRVVVVTLLLGLSLTFQVTKGDRSKHSTR